MFPITGSTTSPGSVSWSWPSGPHPEWVDLSHDYSAETIYWPTAQTFELKVDAKGMTAEGYWYQANTFTTAEHGGTHIACSRSSPA